MMEPDVPARNGFVDYSRLVAAFGIIWFHSEAPGYYLGYAALPFFLVLLGRPTRSSRSSRSNRLMLLFVIWSGIYAVLWMAVALYYGLDILVWWRPWMFVGGTSVHLWFLPFAFFFTVAAPALHRSKATLFLPVIAAAALALLDETRAFPWYQWSIGIIPVLIGFAYARDRRMAALALLASYLVLVVFRPSPDNVVIFAGSALAILALSISMPTTTLSKWSARMSMWIYLNHMLVIFFVEAMGNTGVELALFTMVASILLAIFIEATVRFFQRTAGL